MSQSQPIVVYHVCSIGCWRQVVIEQLHLLRDVGLTSTPILISHVGPNQNLLWLTNEAKKLSIDIQLIRTDLNILHYETFAMLEIDRLAKINLIDQPILYLHAKGVSADFGGGSSHKQQWRRAMEDYLIRPWKRWVEVLGDNSSWDAIGFDWITSGQQHFSGNFWLAHPDWLRKLPIYEHYHRDMNFERYACEKWIGAFKYCRAYSLGCHDHQVWYDNYNWGNVLPAPNDELEKIKLNLGCWKFPARGWINIDSDQSLQEADLHDDVALLSSFSNESVDEIYAGHIAEHVENLRGAFTRWRDILKPGGIATIVVPDCHGSVEMWLNDRHFPGIDCDADSGLRGTASGFVKRSDVDHRSSQQRHRRFFDIQSLKLCLEACGFNKIREIDGHQLMNSGPCSRLGWQIAVEVTK